MSSVINSSSEAKKKDAAHPFLALAIILAITTLAVNFIPSGVYERVVVNGRTLVDPASFHFVEKSYAMPWDFFFAIYQGFYESASLIAMILFVGAGFYVIESIGIMRVVISVLARKLRGFPFEVIALIIMSVIAAQVLFTGQWQLAIVLFPIIIPLFLTLGYDLMTGVAVVLVASCAAFGATLTNPFSIGVAHEIAELPLFSGMGFRFVCFAVIFTVGYLFVIRYARKVKKNPESSLTADISTRYSAMPDEELRFSAAQIRAGIVFIIIFGYLIYGTVAQGFSFGEMSACFIAMCILSSVAYGLGPNEICKNLAEGMRGMFIPAMVLLFARAILYILTETQVIDTVINFLAQFIADKPAEVTAPMLVIIQTIINFILPSASGQALITMPIIVPLADMSGLTRQVATLAFVFGDGFSNFIFFTNGTLIAILAASDVPYGRWFRFFWPLFVIFLVLACMLTVVAVYMGYGPF